jgi:acyl carrier protein
MKDQTKKLLAQNLNLSPEKVTEQTKIVEDLGYDSLDTVEMLMSLEEQLNIAIPDEDAMNLKTLGDVADYIEKLQK